MTNIDDDANVLLAVRNDAGPFVHLGSQFTCNKSVWNGKASASPVAVYLLKVKQNGNASGAALGGIAGALIAQALARDDGLSTCKAADLPESIRKVLDPKTKLGSKDVVIIPMATVSLVKGGGMNNQIKIHAGPDKFNIMTNLFRMFAKPRAMREMGWTLNTPLVPTAATVHDTRSDAERTQPDSKPLWLKILMIAGGVILIILLIALRVLIRS